MADKCPVAWTLSLDGCGSDAGACVAQGLRSELPRCTVAERLAVRKSRAGVRLARLLVCGQPVAAIAPGEWRKGLALMWCGPRSSGASEGDIGTPLPPGSFRYEKRIAFTCTMEPPARRAPSIVGIQSARETIRGRRARRTIYGADQFACSPASRKILTAPATDSADGGCVAASG